MLNNENPQLCLAVHISTPTKVKPHNNKLKRALFFCLSSNGQDDVKR